MDHPSVRINFDTGNISFYTDGGDAVVELEKIAPYVACTHMKDHDGVFDAWHFRTLGEGAVDFAEVLRILKSVDYTGPYSLQPEGVRGEELTETQTKERIEKSFGTSASTRLRRLIHEHNPFLIGWKEKVECQEVIAPQSAGNGTLSHRCTISQQWVGVRILESGGNAADAGVAVGICINVLHPGFTHFGGVAPIIYCPGSGAPVETISGLGRFPRAASIDYFQKYHDGDLPPGILRTVTRHRPMRG